MKFKELLASEFKPYGELSREQLGLLEKHYELLLKWNRLLNLTRIEGLEDAVRFHYCESLFLGGRLPKGPLRVADVGSGAGFPGIPVAVLRPDLEMILIESHQRKAVFLREAARELPNVTVVGMRAEEWRGSTQWVVARAVAPREVLSLAIAPDYALLVGATDIPAGADVIRAPWGAERVVAVSRETVSRGT